MPVVFVIGLVLNAATKSHAHRWRPGEDLEAAPSGTAAATLTVNAVLAGNARPSPSASRIRARARSATRLPILAMSTSPSHASAR